MSVHAYICISLKKEKDRKKKRKKKGYFSRYENILIFLNFYFKNQITQKKILVKKLFQERKKFILSYRCLSEILGKSIDFNILYCMFKKKKIFLKKGIKTRNKNKIRLPIQNDWYFGIFTIWRIGFSHCNNYSLPMRSLFVEKVLYKTSFIIWQRIIAVLLKLLILFKSLNRKGIFLEIKKKIHHLQALKTLSAMKAYY